MEQANRPIFIFLAFSIIGVVLLAEAYRCCIAGDIAGGACPRVTVTGERVLCHGCRDDE